MSHPHHPKNFHHLDLSTLRFDVFSSEEKKRLSVAEIVSSQLIDVHSGCAVIGGLYDPAMGPYDTKSGSCYTCGSTYVQCSGHIGHIKLCVDVYNKIFGDTIYRILRMSCLRDGCFKLQISDDIAKIIILQIKLIEMGYVTEPQELEMFKSSISKPSPDVVDFVDTEMRNQKFAEYSDLLTEPQTNVCNTKTSEELLSSIRNAVISNKREKKCIHCKRYMESFKYTYGKLSMLVSKDKSEFGSKTENEQLLPPKCRNFLTDVYKHNTELLNHLFPVLKSNRKIACPIDIFFTDIVLVTPPNSRPPHKAASRFGIDVTAHHQQTTSYINIIEANANLRAIVSVEEGNNNSKLDEQIVDSLRGNSALEKMLNAWRDLQSCVDQTWDANAGQAKGVQGLKQLIEKKEGIIRMHMLGKRVNYAGRTVITPDPYINVDEIGIPEIFAKTLTYPVPVTEWNVEEIRKYVLNGPDVYPGANFIRNEKANFYLDNKARREGIAKTLLVSKIPIVVHRHLINGDVLLLNRQPSLHRPSIMAHKVKVLKSEKTLRLHYSNCKSYNADFDGDEMNCHCPQNEIARSEANNLVNVANHYLVPKDGTPLGGLIQDHIISGFKMTLRGRFFNREDYQQLVFVGLSHLNRDIKFLPPAIVKPKRLWSGKQVVSTIIINVIPKDCAPINLTSTKKSNEKSKINWQNQEPREWRAGGTVLVNHNMTETEVIIRGGEVLVGVLDKIHFGATPYGLIHSMYELYGGACSTQLLSSFSKLFSFFLQREGFTLGVHDILVVAEANKKRRKIIEASRKIGNKTAAAALKLPADISPSDLATKMEEEYGKNPVFRNQLDREFKIHLSKYTNKINKACMSGLVSKFPENNLQLMVKSGAKGSTVNTMQISCLLGQIELEGKRPPLMISGKSLPSFKAFETTPQSGGFIDGRFMTGIAPQDFFFHCMAGREGLIDTAVKTSRSGYLQRCLIKHLEGLYVNYDMTVRDSDNCVVQFMYGGDGMDIAKAPFLCSEYLPFLDANAAAIVNDDTVEKLKNDYEINKKIEKHKKKLIRWWRKNKKKQREGTIEGQKKKKSKCPDPTNSVYRPDNYLGAIPEGLDKLCGSYLQENKSREREFTILMNVKSMTSLVVPGEPVGLLAATSIGEPSTQMTLNTFHFAGKGEMNVTLGIPRLQEILMRASKDLKTPYMDIPFNQSITDEDAKKFSLKLNRVTLTDVLESINVESYISLIPRRVKVCVLQFNFLPRKLYKDEYCVKPKEIRSYVERKFFKLMFKAIDKYAKNSKKSNKTKKQANDNEDEDGDAKNNSDDDDDAEKRLHSQLNDSDDEEADDEDDTTGSKSKRQKTDEYDYDDDSAAESEDDDNNKEDEDEREEKMYIDVELDETVPNVSKEYDQIVEYVCSTYGAVTEYEFDRNKHLWCKLTFDLPITDNVDFPTLLREVASTAIVSQVPFIRRAMIDDNNQLTLKTEGINITEMFKYDKILDLNRLYTNDIHKVAKTYGIEAAARVIVKEIQTVFGTYGITVDTRHLLLISDYMTFNGTFQPLSRGGMKHSSSTLQQMSFETSSKILELATVFDRCDSLESPASRIMVGKPCKGGTGLFGTLFKLSKEE